MSQDLITTPAQNSTFKTIGLLGIPSTDKARATFESLCQSLSDAGYTILAEDRAHQQCSVASIESVSTSELGKRADLAVVVGGDGNMLGAARELSLHDVGVIGVNRGKLGFLTDLSPEDATKYLSEVLAGEYTTEMRFLLDAQVNKESGACEYGNAMNEVVLHSDKVAHMIEFEVFVDDQFVFSQRSDGLIIATPTGSTAYSLSAGGSILHPGLEAINIIPMFPHTLSSRPLVVPAESKISLRVAPDNEPLHLSCDGHNTLAVKPGSTINIQRQAQHLRLIHPRNYNYFNVLRNKLAWGSRLF
ncbi:MULTISPECIES: NAD(+) kinase [Gammaproteobacteria]|uniref:NAD(+) kinase n=1 Tax=Gammaproteobacteria TaxID=1236 RepID=UPI000DD0EB48|nr:MULTISPECIES: NAD(+) kinase [Gammaproteobacteria]RTE86904.1 NAD(+) kinase [Aliidiomarina sp. B3213]TCZ93306.1 NAD(+) kinase [Lysobacter sp. N42]